MKTNNQFSNNVSYPIAFIMNAFLKSPMGMLFSLIFISQMIRQANAATLPLNYKAYYPLEGNARDYSINAFHGTTVGNLITTTDHRGRANSAMLFDGTNHIFGIANGYPTRDRTISAWIKPSRLTTPSGQGMGVLGYGGGTCGTSFWMSLNNVDAGIKTVYEEQGNCRVNRILYNGAPSPVDQWQHFVITTDSTGTKIYLNGANVASNSIYITNTNTKDKLFTIGIEVSPDGNSAHTDVNGGNFYGVIDDVIIYDYALTNAEISEIFINQPPSLGNNQFSITENTPLTITPEMLSANDSLPQIDNLQFIVDNVKNGRFEFQNSPGTAITTFTQQQIKNAAVRFVPNGNKQASAFNIKVSDGLLWTESMPANIVFNTLAPTGQPSKTPSGQPSSAPSKSPSTQPSAQPNSAPTATPTGSPTNRPSHNPSGQPSSVPSEKPSLRPSHQPTVTPTGAPTNRPSRNPSGRPTHRPSQIFRGALTFFPSTIPTPAPSNQPIDQLSLQIDTIINYYLIIIAALAGCIVGSGSVSLFSYLCPKKQAAIQPARAQENAQQQIIINNNR